MDAKRTATEAGTLLASATIAHTLTLEAERTNSPILSHPVPLEGPFRPFDPAQTFGRQTRWFDVAATPDDLCARRWIVPPPETFAWERAESALAAVVGCQRPMSFEVYVQRHQAEFYFVAPAAQIAFVASAVLATYPVSALVEAPDPVVRIHRVSALVDLYSPAPYHRAVRRAASLWPQLFRLCSVLGPDDVLLYQVIFVMTQSSWRDNIGAILHAEQVLGPRAPFGRTAEPKSLVEPLFAAVVRIATTNPALRSGIESLAGLFTADGKPFRYRSVDDFRRTLSGDALRHMIHTRMSHTVAQLVSVSELASFVHPPDASAAASVRLDVLDGLPVPERLRGPGMPLGVNASGGVPVSVFYPLRRQYNTHCAFVGTSGKGKSLAVMNFCRYLAKEGYGFCILDPHRNTAATLAGLLGDIDPVKFLYLDFDARFPLAYNVFAHGIPEDYGRMTLDVIQTLRPLFATEGYHRTEHFLANGIYGLFVLKKNLATLPLLYSPGAASDHLRRQIIREAKNDAVRRFWQEEFPSYQPTVFSPILNRSTALFLDDRTLLTFSSDENRIDIAEAMESGKSVLVALPSSIEAARIVGGFLIGQCKHAAFRRAVGARQFFLIVDELSRFRGSALPEILDETTKRGLSLWLALQQTNQIPTELAKTIYGIDTFVFGVNMPDARQYAQLFNGRVAPESLANQRVGECYARIGQDFVNFTSPPPSTDVDPEAAARIIAYSEAHYYVTSPPVQASPFPKQRIIETF